MNPVTIDLKDILEANGVGTFGATNGWGIYIGFEPETPDTTITLYDTGGGSPLPNLLLDFPTIQTRIRGSVGDYEATYQKALEVRDVLLGLPSQTINGTLYDGVWANSDIIYLTRTKDRPVFVINWRIAREPATGNNRNPL